MISTLFLIATAALANPPSDKAGSQETKTAYAAESPANTTPYVFGWMDYSEPKVTLRGGRTKGIPVTLAEDASDRWSGVAREACTSGEIVNPSEVASKCLRCWTARSGEMFEFSSAQQ